MLAEDPQSNLQLDTPVDVSGANIGVEINALYQFSRSLVTTSTLDLLYDRIVHYVVDIVQISFCRLMIRTPDRTLACKSIGTVGEIPKIVDPTGSQRIYDQVMADGEPEVIDNRLGSLSMMQSRIQRAHGGCALCLVPMQVEQEVVGLLILGDQSSEGFHDGKLRLAKLMADQSASAIHRSRLSDYLRYSHLEAVVALVKALEVRDPSTAGHGKMVMQYAEKTAEVLKVPPAEIETIRLGALLHDVGKIGIPDEILRKPGPLTEDEWKMMRRHPDLGADIVLSMSHLTDVAAVIRSHHEHYNGSGYPLGIKGDWINLGARILSVADAYDAMTSQRVYRQGLSHDEAVAELMQCAGTDFDPVIVNAFISLFEMKSDGVKAAANKIA